MAVTPVAPETLGEAVDGAAAHTAEPGHQRDEGPHGPDGHGDAHGDDDPSMARRTYPAGQVKRSIATRSATARVLSSGVEPTRARTTQSWSPAGSSSTWVTVQASGPPPP